MPVVQQRSPDQWWIYVSCRDANGKSHIGRLSADVSGLSQCPPTVSELEISPVLSLGSPGTFDDSGVSSVNIFVRFEWVCLDEGRSGGSNQQTGEIDWLTAAGGWGFASDAFCRLPDGTPTVLSVTAWATAVDSLGNSSTSDPIAPPAT